MASSRRVFIGFILVHEVPANAKPAAQKGNLVHYLGVGRGESTRARQAKTTTLQTAQFPYIKSAPRQAKTLAVSPQDQDSG